MPYKSEKFKLKGLQDRRKRLTDNQRKQIEELYQTGNYSLNDLAKQFSVSKKTILLIVNKDSADRERQYRKEHWRDYQKTGEERNEIVREHRRYKQKLYKEGKLKEDESIGVVKNDYKTNGNY